MPDVTVVYVPAVPAQVDTVDRLRVYSPGDTARTGPTVADLTNGVQQPNGSWTFQVPEQADGTYPLRVTVTYVDATVADDINDSVTFPLPERRGDSEELAPWVSAAALQAAVTGLSAANAELAAQAATNLLYALSGRRYDGYRVSVLAAPLLPGPGRVPLPVSSPWGFAGRRTTGTPETLGEIDAGVFPVTDVVALSIGTHEFDPDAVRIINGRFLRLAETIPAGDLLSINYWTDGDGNVYSLWPGGNCGCGCGPARAMITIEWGEPPPAGGRIAALALGKEVANGIMGNACRLPGNVTSVNRQGVSVLLDPATFLDKGRTGVPLADMWLAEVNPNRLMQDSTVWTPDMPMSQRIG